jgi:hypothetical protein
MSCKNQILISLCVILLFFSEYSVSSEKIKQTKDAILWEMSDLITSDSSVRRIGNPKIIEYKKGKALEFNGLNDGIFLDKLPISGMNEFTIEAIFRPDNGGNFEQRFFHSGEIRGDRVLLEIRSTATDWYFDAFVQSGAQKMTLIEPTLLHPLNQWVHVAYVVNRGKLSTYVNGQKELEGAITFKPVQTGKTSIGVRLNEQSWFKGAISKIRISPKALNTKDFLVL